MRRHVAVTSTERRLSPLEQIDAFRDDRIQRYPFEAPGGACSPEGIQRSYGIARSLIFGCSGPWATGTINPCPPQLDCQGVDIFRWTDDGWQYRGRFYSRCVLDIDESGLPRSVNDQFFSFNRECLSPIQTVSEPAFGSLEMGDVGDRVRQVQRKLVDMNLLNDAVDGRFGPNTRNAVFDYQHLVGLQPTGIVDDEMLARMGF